MLRAGTAEIDITPEIGRRIPGQWRRRIAESVRDPLLVNALVLESSDTRLALVSADALSLKNSVVAAARDMILSRTGIPAERTLLHATHTHTGPPVMDGLGTESDPEIVEALTTALAEAVTQANARLGPATLATWCGEAPNLAFTRRFRMNDGTVRMHPPKGSPDIIEPESPADPTIAGLHVWGEDGNLIATCVNFACHPIVVGGATFYSADYPGGVRRALKRECGDQAAVLYLNGPCGDVGPDNAATPRAVRYGEEWVERIGSGIAGFAIGYASVAQAADDVSLRSAATHVEIPIREVPADLLAEAKSRLTEEDIAVPPQEMDLIKLREAYLLHQEREQQDYVNAEIMAAGIGDAAIVGLPGEIFTEFGRQVRAASPFACTLVAELANGCHGYVPTEEAFPGGGYETWLARSSKLVPDAGALMVEAAKRVLAEVSA
jgi:neutral ceramidase